MSNERTGDSCHSMVCYDCGKLWLSVVRGFDYCQRTRGNPGIRVHVCPNGSGCRSHLPVKEYRRRSHMKGGTK